MKGILINIHALYRNNGFNFTICRLAIDCFSGNGGRASRIFRNRNQAATVNRGNLRADLFYFQGAFRFCRYSSSTQKPASISASLKPFQSKFGISFGYWHCFSISPSLLFCMVTSSVQSIISLPSNI